jgi:hypothetical protein
MRSDYNDIVIKYEIFMKRIFLLFTVLTFLTTNCANQAITPFSPETDEIPSKLPSISRMFVYNKDSVSVYPESENSWLYIDFFGEIDTSTAGVIIERFDGIEVPYFKKWSIKGRKTELILKPQDTLEYNTTYLLKIISNKIIDINNNLIDKDSDGIGGENIDDDHFYTFTTLKSDGSSGDYAVSLTDIFRPFIWRDIYFLAGDSTVKEIWTDVDIAINIYDLTWSKKDKSLIIRSVDANTVNDSTIMLISNNGEEVKVTSSIAYESDTAKENFGRVVIDPEENLKPEKSYILRIFGSIKDEAGNELWEYNNIALEKKFKTLSCNYDSSECLVKAPTIINWIYLGSSFEVEFSKRIDRNTININTIYLEENGIRIDGDLSIRNAGRNSIVVFSRKDGKNISGTTAYVTSLISDLKGNKKGVTESHDF